MCLPAPNLKFGIYMQIFHFLGRSIQPLLPVFLCRNWVYIFQIVFMFWFLNFHFGYHHTVYKSVSKFMEVIIERGQPT